MAKVGVILSGSGVFDGSELHEAVLTLLSLDTLGHDAQCLSLDMDQAHVIDHARQDVAENETRNCLEESARIARGAIKDINEVSVDDFDAFILPGGFGAAKNLSDYAFKGAEMQVNPDLAQFLRKAHAAEKVIAAICIAPAILAKLFPGARLCSGNSKDLADAMISFGAIPEDVPVDSLVVDAEKKFVTTPAYMCDASISEIQKGIHSLVEKVGELSHEKVTASI